MTKDVLLSISGTQYDVDGDGPVEIITGAEYYLKNGNHFITYDEVVSDTGDTVKNVIKIGKDKVDVIKRGPMGVHMIFEKDKKNLAFYNTMFGDLLIGIETTAISHTEDDMNITTEIDYALDINENHISDCHIHLSVKSKEDKFFSLS